MVKKTLTTANAKMMMTLPILPVPVEIKGFSVDDLANMDEAQFTESRMGVDGYKSSGFINTSRKLNIVLEATSPSIEYFNLWISAMKTAKESLPITLLTISSKALGYTFTCYNGTLESGKEIPDFKKTTQPITYKIDFESIVPVPLA